MDLNSILREIEEDRIGFEDRISLVFMIMGGIFFALILVMMMLNVLQFEQMEFESPFM